MSEEDKQREMATSPSTPAENVPVAGEPHAATVVAPGETAQGATTQVSEAGPALTDVSVPDHRELEAWNEQVRRRMRQKSRRSFLGWGAGLVAGTAGFRWLMTRRAIDG